MDPSQQIMEHVNDPKFAKVFRAWKSTSTLKYLMKPFEWIYRVEQSKDFFISRIQQFQNI